MENKSHTQEKANPPKRFFLLRRIISAVRIWVIETFLVQVTVSKCEHDFRLTHFKVYRVGKTKWTISTHKCRKCKLIRKYETKY